MFQSENMLEETTHWFWNQMFHVARLFDLRRPGEM